MAKKVLWRMLCIGNVKCKIHDEGDESVDFSLGISSCYELRLKLRHDINLANEKLFFLFALSFVLVFERIPFTSTKIIQLHFACTKTI